MPGLDTFEYLPLKLEPLSKAVSAPNLAFPALDAELAELNALHRTFHQQLEGAALVPPPPLPVNSRRTANINKLKDSGNAMNKRGAHTDAIKLYSLGLQMALSRPTWEPSQLVREEAAQLLSNRAQVHIALQGWLDAAVDAQASVELKPLGNAKAWWQRGTCLVEMDRLEEAREWVANGLEMEGEEKELVELLKKIEGKLSRRKGA